MARTCANGAFFIFDHLKKKKRKNGQLVSLVCDYEKRKKIRMRHIYLYINLPHGAWAAAILSTVA